MPSDKLGQMFSQQEEFIALLQEKRGHPALPLDLSVKENQQFLKSMAYECMHELFESNMLLKNTKKHRITDLPDFDRESYKEELADVLHYLVGIMICSGISFDEIYKMYMDKGRINIDRINGGY